MIKILDKHVADKIAAGEVIDRPVSIIKELLENSLDAEATSIAIEIKNGGKSYIRVTDNGCGIPANEVELAFRRHATSKITAAEDLNAIETLGFRGEALASICAVARVELITKTADSKMGRKVVIEGSEVLENSAIGCPDGTTITVRDLFFNVPARSKFLATDSAETRRIVDMVSRIALSYGDVKISLTSGSNKVFSTRGNGNILNNIISIYGSETGKDLIPVESSMSGFVLKGFVSSPAASAPSRNKQIFCVNGRIISSSVLEKALDEAYKEKLFHGRFPIAFLFLAMPPEKLDVNVHPTKKEVRFDDDHEVLDFVTKAVKEALNAKEAVPQIREEGLKSLKAEQGVQYDFSTIKREENIISVLEERQDTLKEIAEETKEINVEIKSADDKVDINNILTTMRQEVWAGADIEISAPVRRPFDINNLRTIGTIFNTYILAADEDSFYLIDQHAAHERVFYERLLEQYNTEEKHRQTLLMPLNFNVSAQVASTEEIWLDKVSSMGYDIEFFGNNTYLVREIPAFMDLDEAETFLSDMFKELEDKPDLNNKKTLEKIITRSCKSAVKGGDRLDINEIDALMKDLRSCINPFSCPHGRPTFIRMTKYEIEKMFKRV
ncbi:MAG: DNA mismatch repair endonuclease MutL [Firmicutes bacterium]|nr:DNA mismatch repair endonuclease MutL [Bacillota bacterium]